MPVRITLMVGARACPLRPNDTRWLAAELPDAFPGTTPTMHRAAPAVSKAHDVALQDGAARSSPRWRAGKLRICRWDPFFWPHGSGNG